MDKGIHEVCLEREDLVRRDLIKKGYIVDLTLKKYPSGTPDFVCTKDGKIKFVEVKHVLGRFLPTQDRNIKLRLDNGEDVELAIVNEESITYIKFTHENVDDLLTKNLRFFIR